MCVDVASYTILTSEVALVHLPVFKTIVLEVAMKRCPY